MHCRYNSKKQQQHLSEYNTKLTTIVFYYRVTRSLVFPRTVLYLSFICPDLYKNKFVKVLLFENLESES